MPEYLLDPHICFLNHGSFGACPIEILDEQQRWRRELEREPVDFLDRRFPERLDLARARTAEFLGARPDELVFMTNATSAVNAVLRSHPPPQGSEVLTSNHRYDAVGNTLRRAVEASDARLIEANIPFPLCSPDEIVQAFTEAITPRTSMMVIDQITSPTALVFPVQELVELAHSHGCTVLVDGAHAPGQVDLDLTELQPDWWVGNLHKWVCAPKGAAVLWTSSAHQEHMHSTVTSHGYGGGYHAEFDWPGTFDPTAILAAVRAMDLHEELGGASFRQANHLLAARGRALLIERLDLDPPHPDDDRLYAAMATLPFPIQDQPALALRDRLFHEHQIEVPVIHWSERNWMRISAFSAYNTLEDYARLAEAIEVMLSSPG